MGENSSAQFKFNNFQEIRSHSSHLYNERLAILFYLLDMDFMGLYENPYSVTYLRKVYARIKQLYKNVRMLVRFNGVARAQLSLETKDQGIYTMDIQMTEVTQMFRYCDYKGYTQGNIDIMTMCMENLEMVIKDLLQYFMYFVRPDFRQKPDIDTATEHYKEMADALTIEQLQELVGKRNKIDFAGLGTDRIDFKDEIEYDPAVDGPLEEYSGEDEDSELDINDDTNDEYDDTNEDSNEVLNKYTNDDTKDDEFSDSFDDELDDDTDEYD